MAVRFLDEPKPESAGTKIKFLDDAPPAAGKIRFLDEPSPSPAPAVAGDGTFPAGGVPAPAAGPRPTPAAPPADPQASASDLAFVEEARRRGVDLSGLVPTPTPESLNRQGVARALREEDARRAAAGEPAALAKGSAGFLPEMGREAVQGVKELPGAVGRGVLRGVSSLGTVIEKVTGDEDPARAARREAQINELIAPPTSMTGQLVEGLGKEVTEAAPVVAALGPLQIPARLGRAAGAVARGVGAGGAAPAVAGATAIAGEAGLFGGAAQVPEAVQVGSIAPVLEGAVHPFTAAASIAGKVAAGQWDEITVDELVNAGFIIYGAARGMKAGSPQGRPREAGGYTARDAPDFGKGVKIGPDGIQYVDSRPLSELPRLIAKWDKDPVKRVLADYARQRLAREGQVAPPAPTPKPTAPEQPKTPRQLTAEAPTPRPAATPPVAPVQPIRPSGGQETGLPPNLRPVAPEQPAAKGTPATKEPAVAPQAKPAQTPAVTPEAAPAGVGAQSAAAKQPFNPDVTAPEAKRQPSKAGRQDQSPSDLFGKGATYSGRKKFSASPHTDPDRPVPYEQDAFKVVIEQVLKGGKTYDVFTEKYVPDESGMPKVQRVILAKNLPLAKAKKAGHEAYYKQLDELTPAERPPDASQTPPLRQQGQVEEGPQPVGGVSGQPQGQGPGRPQAQAEEVTPPGPPTKIERGAGEPSPKGAFSARRVDVDRDRAELGREQIPSANTRQWDDVLEEAATKIDADEADSIAKRIINRPEPMSDVQTAGLVIRRVEIGNRYDDLVDSIIAKREKGEQTQQEERELRDLESKFDDITRAMRLSGTEKGRALAAQRLTINKNYDLVSVKNRFEARKGAKATDSETAQLKELTERLKQTEAKLEQVQKNYSDLLAEKTMRREARTSRRGERPSRKALVDKIRDLARKGC